MIVFEQRPKAAVLTRDGFAPQGTYGNVWRHFQQEVILASSTYRPGMPLNILQYTGQPPTIGNYLAPNDTGAEIEKAWFRSNEDG